MDKERAPCLICGCNDQELLRLYGKADYGGWTVVGSPQIRSPVPHFQGYVQCAKCGMRGPVADSQSGAINLWNNRIDFSQAQIK